MSESEFQASAGNEQLDGPAHDFAKRVSARGSVEDRYQRMQKAELYVADLLKLGVVSVRSNCSVDWRVFLDVLIEDCRVQAFVRPGGLYIGKPDRQKWDWSHPVPYRLATLTKTKVAGADGKAEWRFMKQGSSGREAGGPMQLSEAGARTMSVITGVPIAQSIGMTEIGRGYFFKASSALQALADWCQAHPLVAKQNDLSAQRVMAGDFSI